MPRINQVKFSQKPATCGHCGDKIPRGSPYRWWKRRYGSKQVRCLKPGCAPRRSELTGSEILASAWDAQDDASDAIATATCASDITDALDTLKEAVQEIVDSIQEKVDNIESGFGHSVATSEELADRGSQYEDWHSEIDSVSIDGEVEVKVEIDRGDGPNGPSQVITFTVVLDGDFGDATVTEQVTMKHGAAVQPPLTVAEIAEAVKQVKQAFDDALDGWRDEARSAVDSCPE